MSMFYNTQLKVGDNIKTMFGNNDLSFVRSYLITVIMELEHKRETYGVLYESDIYEALNIPYHGDNSKGIIDSDIRLDSFVNESNEHERTVDFVLTYDKED